MKCSFRHGSALFLWGLIDKRVYFKNLHSAVNTEVEVKALVPDHQEATRVELCELFAIKTENWVSRTTICPCVQKLGVHRKKKPGTVAKPRQKESKK
jgi:transposase